MVQCAQSVGLFPGSSLGRAYLDLWANAVKRMTGQPVQPVATPDSKDRRFIDPEWSSNQFLDFLKQAYLLTTHWADYLVKHRIEAFSMRARFAPMTNPERLAHEVAELLPG